VIYYKKIDSLIEGNMKKLLCFLFALDNWQEGG
jgi:hypothetical protein